MKIFQAAGAGVLKRTLVADHGLGVARASVPTNPPFLCHVWRQGQFRSSTPGSVRYSNFPLIFDQLRN